MILYEMCNWKSVNSLDLMHEFTGIRHKIVNKINITAMGNHTVISVKYKGNFM